MVGFISQHLTSSRLRQLRLALVLAALAWIVVDRQSFVDLWLTPDQEGRLWFRLGKYERASRAFEDPRWKGFSLYAAQDFATAESYFSQYQDAEFMLARANAIAHQLDYTGARKAYEELASRYPDHPAPAVNMRVVDAILEAIRDKSGTEKNGSGKPGRKPGDGQGSSESEQSQDPAELEQYSAEQLLQDPALTEMWLRQIQRDPSEFLTTKFYLQLQEQEGGAE